MKIYNEKLKLKRKIDCGFPGMEKKHKERGHLIHLYKEINELIERFGTK